MCVMTGFPVTCYFHTQTDRPPLKSIIQSPPLRISALSPADYSPVPDALLPPETFQAPLTRSLPISWSHRGGSGARLQGKGRPSPPSVILPFNNSPSCGKEVLLSWLFHHQLLSVALKRKRMDGVEPKTCKFCLYQLWSNKYQAIIWSRNGTFVGLNCCNPEAHCYVQTSR